MANKYANLVGTNKIKDEYSKINTGFDQVEADINDVNSRITAVDNRLETIFDQVEADINDVNSLITALDNRVDTIITTPIDDEAAAQELVDARAGFSTIGGRLTKIEEDIETNTQELDNVKAGFSTIGDRMTQIEEDITTYTQELVDARAGFSTIGDRMTQIEEDITTYTQELDNVKAGFSTIGDRMTQIEEDLETYTQELDNVKAGFSTIEDRMTQIEEDIETHKAENATLNQLGHVNHAVLTATLDTSWSGSSAPYTKTITVSGILSTDVPFIDIVMSGTYTTDTARQEAWGHIYRATTANDSITFYANEKPTVSLPIQIKVVR